MTSQAMTHRRRTGTDVTEVIVADRYPTVDRREGGSRPVRLSNTQGRALLEQAIRNTENRRALERAIAERESRAGQKGATRVPRSAPGRAAKLAAKGLRRPHPLQLVAMALAELQQATLDVPDPSVQMVPGHSLGGFCVSPDPLNFADIRTGLPSSTCQTGQAVGPGYGVNCFLGTGIWAKRLVSPNYNQLSWWIPQSGCADAVAMGGTFAVGGYKQLPSRSVPTTHPAVNPHAMKVGDWQPQAVPLPTELSRGTDRTSAPTERREVGGSSSAEPPRIRPEQRPSKNTRERKVVVPRYLLRALGAITEGLDAVGSVYKCLPSSVKNKAVAANGGRKLGVKAKAELLWKHWDQIDMRCAVFNLLYDNLVEDRAYAFVSKHSKSPHPLPGSVSGGRSLQISRQGDAELPHGRLPTDELRDWLKAQIGVK